MAWQINPAVHDYGVELNTTVTLGVLKAGHNVPGSAIAECGLPNHWDNENFLSKLYGTGKIVWDNLGTGASFEMNEMGFRDPYGAMWAVDMELADNLTMDLHSQRNRALYSTISGPGQLTIDANFESDHWFRLGTAGDAPNTYQGGTVLNNTSSVNPNRRFIAGKTGVFGWGDLTLNDKAKLVIENQPDMIDDTGSLWLVTGSVLELNNGTETVAGFYIDGVPQIADTYNSTAHPLLLSGSGNLIVVPVTTLTSVASSDWAVGGTWDGSGATPSAATPVVIDGGFTVTNASGAARFMDIVSGTLNVTGGGELQMSTGSTYEWEVGLGETDTIDITGGILDLDKFKLKILDAGGRGITAGNELTLFTYEDGVTNVQTQLGAVTFVTSELDANWNAGVGFGGLALNDVAGRIYLTGLVRPVDVIDVVVAPGVTDAVETLLPGQRFGDVEIGAAGVLTVDSTLTDISVTNLTLGAGSMVRSTAAAAGEEVTITLGGTLGAGDGGSSSLGDETDIVAGGFTNLTLGADSTYEWTFSDAGGLDDQYVYVRGAATLDNNVTIRLVDNGGVANNEDVVLLMALGFVYDDLLAIGIELPGDWTSGDLVVDGGSGLLILQNLVTVAGPLPGDANNNGTVGDADWVIFKAQFGGAPGGVNDDADFNDDGRVDLRDLAILKAAWDGGVGAPEMDATVTPEPATMSLLALGGLLVFKRRRGV